MKKSILTAGFVLLSLFPVRAAWSIRYWYCPGNSSFSDAKVYWQSGRNEGKNSGRVAYIGGEGGLPNGSSELMQDLQFKGYTAGFYIYNGLPWIYNKDNIIFTTSNTEPINNNYTTLIVDEGITHIGKWWFRDMKYLEEVSLPTTLESIGVEAFKNNKMPGINIPDKVWFIAERAFENCSNLNYIKIPAGATLFDEAFKGSGLQFITFTDIADLRGGYVFQNCKNFKHFTIPEGSTLSDLALAGSSLETVIVGHNVSYGKSLFKNSKNLQSVVFKDNINEIIEEMFYGCSSLSSFNIQSSVKKIGSKAFQWSGLDSITIPNNVTSIDAWAFTNAERLTSVKIPNSVIQIGIGVFKSSGLTSVTFPGSVEIMEKETFAGCNNLISVKICEGVKTVGYSAFQSCKKLETVSLPASLEFIDHYGLGYCESLKVIECNGTTPPATSNWAFTGSDNTKISLYVPYGSVDVYKNASVWKEFKNIGTYPAGIRLDKHSVTVKGSTALKLNAYLMPHDAIQSVEWHSKNPNVAEVNNGTVRFKAPGTAAIVATTHNGIFRDSCLIRVLEGNLDGRPTFADSLFGKWVQCDENLQIVPGPEELEFRKVVVTTEEGYETHTYEGANIWPDGSFIGILTVDEKSRTFKVVSGRTPIGARVIELTKNKLRIIDIYGNTEYLFVRIR